jgi:glycosyltransferase involved in cell wall biosynthesis
MKILLVIDNLGSGGAQRLFVHLARGLSKVGHQVDILIYNSDSCFYQEDFESAGIDIHVVVKKKPGFSWEVVKKLRATIKNDYDHVISTMHGPSIYASLANIGLSKSRLIVCEVSSSSAPVSRLKKLLFYLASLSSSAVVANSVSEAEIMQKRPGLSKKVYAIWNGYETLTPVLDIPVRRADVTQLLIVGRIAYPKNGVNLLKGLSLFHSKNNWLPTVLWAGRRDSDARSVNMQARMDSYLTTNPQVASHFEMLGEVKHVDELYNSSDALLHLSLYEGLPNVICESMLLGCPVIASNVCDHPIVLGHGERGLLCDPLSPDSICNAIEQFVALPLEERARISQKAQRFALKNFNIERMVSQFEKLLE